MEKGEKGAGVCLVSGVDVDKTPMEASSATRPARARLPTVFVPSGNGEEGAGVLVAVAVDVGERPRDIKETPAVREAVVPHVHEHLVAAAARGVDPAARRLRLVQVPAISGVHTIAEVYIALAFTKK